MICLSTLFVFLFYFGINSYWKNPGWSTIFYYTLVNRQPYPLSNPQTLSFLDYFTALFKGVLDFILGISSMLFFTITAYSFYMIYLNKKSKKIKDLLQQRENALSIICVIYVLTRICAFPFIAERFFSGIYIIATLALLIIVSKYFSKNKSKIMSEY